jgi:AbrB family looped-hinge helix DNA binding protein
MSFETAQISENGRIVIPAVYRKAMGLKGGEVVTIRLDEEGLHIQSRAQAIKRAQAIVRKYVPEGVSLVDELIAERRREAKREQSGL